MNALLELPRYENMLVPVLPDARGMVSIGCSDKRAPQAGSPVLPDTYYQLLGAVEVAHDVATAWEAQEPGGFVELGQPVEELGIIVAGTARAYGLRLAAHWGCAALANRQAINGTQMSGSDYLRAKAAYDGDMSLTDYQELAAGAQRIGEAGLITPTQTATETLQSPRPERDLPDGVPFATLAPTGDARAFVVSHVLGRGFNVRRLTAQNPAYVSTFPAVDAVHNAIRNIIPVDRDLLRMAYAARLGAIGGHHILHEDEPYPMYVISRDGDSRVYTAEDFRQNPN